MPKLFGVNHHHDKKKKKAFAYILNSCFTIFILKSDKDL